MSPEAQHRAIAEACGYYLIHDEEGDSVALRNGDVNFRGGWHRAGTDADQFAWEDAPDYLSDLNALHEAEKTIKHPEVYCYELSKVVCRERQHFALTECICATAAQRAEAFLRTLGKWDDSQ